MILAARFPLDPAGDIDGVMAHSANSCAHIVGVSPPARWRLSGDFRHCQECGNTELYLSGAMGKNPKDDYLGNAGALGVSLNVNLRDRRCLISVQQEIRHVAL